MMRGIQHLFGAAEADGNIPELAELLAVGLVRVLARESRGYSTIRHCGSIG
jgi:hypothetical protein